MHRNNEYNKKPENPYLTLDYWHFAIISTLMCVFFPWSLLFTLLVYGLEDTKCIVQALIHDAFKTLLAVLLIIIPIILLLIIILSIVVS